MYYSIISQFFLKKISSCNIYKAHICVYTKDNERTQKYKVGCISYKMNPNNKWVNFVKKDSYFWLTDGSGYCRRKSDFWTRGSWDSILVHVPDQQWYFDINISESWFPYLSNKNNDVCSPWRKKLDYIVKLPMQGLTENFPPLEWKYMLFYVLYPAHVLYVLFTILYSIITVSNNKVIAIEVRLRHDKTVFYGRCWLPRLELW